MIFTVTSFCAESLVVISYNTSYYQRYAHIAGVDDYWIHQIKEEINDRIEILSEM